MRRQQRQTAWTLQLQSRAPAPLEVAAAAGAAAVALTVATAEPASQVGRQEGAVPSLMHSLDGKGIAPGK